MGQSMRDLENERQNLEQMDNITREMRRIEKNVNTFEKQVQKLAKQKCVRTSSCERKFRKSESNNCGY